MYCFDILELPFLSKIELVAGENGLNHSIFWVHIAEYAQTENELISILKPDDFVIVKGDYLGNICICMDKVCNEEKVISANENKRYYGNGNIHEIGMI